MSHFTKLDRANIKSPDAFIAACRELGFDGAVERDGSIKDYSGKMIKTQYAVKTGRYALGLQKRTDGKYDMVADWWGVRVYDMPAGIKTMVRNDTDLQDALLRTTTKHTLTAHYRRLGFMTRVTEDAQHNIKVKLSR